MNFNTEKIAHDLCRGVQKSPGRSRLQDIFTGRSGRKEDFGMNREHLPYEWRVVGAQFLTPLLQEQEQERIREMPFSRGHNVLDREVLLFVKATHQQIIDFNSACVEDLLSQMPYCRRALDPYTSYLPLTSLVEPSMQEPLNASAFTEAARSLSVHPAIQYLLSIPPLLDARSEDQVENLVRITETQIRSAGTMTSPTSYQDFIFQTPVNSKERQLFGFVAALTSVRAMLRIIDQMVYQSVLDNKPPILNDENIFAINWSSHTTGKGVDVQYQPDGLSGLVPTSGDIFLLKAIPNYGFDDDYLCEVSSVGFNFSKETGTTEQSKLRVLDENLCPFGSFWQKVFGLQ